LPSGSIPNEAIVIFQLTESFQLHYGPGVHSLHNRNRNLPGVKGWSLHNAENITNICEPILY
jgi:hypothetical protein